MQVCAPILIENCGTVRNKVCVESMKSYVILRWKVTMKITEIIVNKVFKDCIMF